MLTNLTIQNIVLIDALDIALKDGFCVLTGETGAGKSILLDALGLALGKRGSASLVRAGEEQGSVTATFDIERNPLLNNLLLEQGIASEGEAMLRRVIYQDGRSKAFINDTPVSANFLADFSPYLIEIHGQHDQRGLLNPKTHRLVLDEYGQTEPLLARVREAFHAFNALKNRLAKLIEEESKARADEEYLKFVLNELTGLDLRPGLEAELASARSRLLNREKFIEAVNGASEVINEGGAEDSLRSAQTILLKYSEVNSNFAEIADMLERALIEVSEAVSSLQKAANQIDDSEENLEAIEERLFGLRNAARKYHVTADALEQYRDEIAEKLDFMANKDARLAELEKEVAAARALYVEAAAALSSARKQASDSLEKKLVAELVPLKMENTRLKVELEPLDEPSWSADGVDRVSFLVRTNPGAPFAPIAKIASGGELSRFMLALKVVLSDIKSVPVMIFDEVDTGIGGAVADAVGRRLAKLGKTLQVFAITHQPQVAARGSFHLKVQKLQEVNKTTTTVRPLSDIERQEELARMLAGDTITDEARSAAIRLLQAEAA